MRNIVLSAIVDQRGECSVVRPQAIDRPGTDHVINLHNRNRINEDCLQIIRINNQRRRIASVFDLGKLCCTDSSAQANGNNFDIIAVDKFLPLIAARSRDLKIRAWLTIRDKIDI